MNELLNLAVKAHGGLVVMTIDTKAGRMVTDFPGQDKRSIFEPNRIVIEKVDGTRDNPEESFQGQQRESPWDRESTPTTICWRGRTEACSRRRRFWTISRCTRCAFFRSSGSMKRLESTGRLGF